MTSKIRNKQALAEEGGRIDPSVGEPGAWQPDELHTREETRGSQATVYRFYQHQKCRQGWVTDLINALRQNNAGHLADDLQHVYDSWQARPPAPATASFPPAASNACPAVSSIGAPTTSPGPPCSARSTGCADAPSPPVGGSPPLLLGAATAVSTDLDARAPVQESLPKNLLEQESARSPPPGSAVRDGWGQDWLSRQQHPVCVDNGCFGNANHLHRGAPGLGLGRSLLLRDAGSARSPKQPRNEPEEDFYVSTESPLRLEETARSGGPQPPDSQPKQKAVPGSEHSEPPGSFVDVRSPLLIQQQFDVEQKRVGMLREHGGDGDTWMETTTPVATPAPRDASLSCDTSVKPPVQEKELPAGEVASSTPSMPTKEKVLPASVDPPQPVARSFEGTSGRTASRLSSATSIWVPCSNVERDVELSKPGVLCPWLRRAQRQPADARALGGPAAPFQGRPIASPSAGTHSWWGSGEALSRVSLGCPAPAAREDPGGKEAAGASRDSRLPPSWDSTPLGTHEVRVDHYPSTQLGAGSDLRDRAGPFGNSPVFDSSGGQGTATTSSQAKVPPGDSNGPSLPYIVPAVGIALISAVAFLVYARLQK
ncbi:PREDICTED: LOW QUALITY PROTEIN: uncharacterized protein LOC103923522 [Pygoscelis adeliae]|uniref:LOW QUALITY PROTEIN: uncharacterized protein LOC103923522 n=1 Tax=Pygoscelis adeliae TaxID=9238 RepID=UPI0004F4FB3B|nr:PREDICTED: LOW QUALITY PROTEIN: uncharacterized protein LOC103923522 [Pygoscelis adeliae]